MIRLVLSKSPDLCLSNNVMIRRRFKKRMDKFFKQFLPSVSQVTQKNSQEILIEQKIELPTPPLTPTDMNIIPMESDNIKNEDSSDIKKKISSTPNLKKTFFQVSRSLLRSFESKTIEIEDVNNMPTNVNERKGSVKKQSFQNNFDKLKFYLEEIHSYFEALLLNGDKNDTSNNMTCQVYKVTSRFLTSYIKCLELNDKLTKNAINYDCAVDLEYNGYRTLNSAFEKCCSQCVNVVKSIYKQKQNFYFQVKFHLLPSSIKEYETWCLLIEKFQILFEIADEMQQKTCEMHSLLLDQSSISSNIEKSLFLLASTNQEAFFGRSCAFQFCESLRLPLTACTVALASYNESYDITTGANGNDLVRKTAKSLFSSTKYMLNPELRAQKLATIMKNADVEFCKAFWQLTESSIVQLGSDMITPSLSVAVVKTIEPVLLITNKMDSNETVEVKPPLNQKNEAMPINIRILSAEFRQGMEALDKSFNDKRTNVPKSSNLILHAHGGGFIAHSSKSHEIYLKPWCKDLHIPIVSIDYSLAPEFPFPIASEECFYVYVWCLLNKEMLGWTGEKIICVGDSAGGVLVTNIVQRAIMAGIRIPDALVPIYTPFLLSYSLSPSRLMSVMDPLLNLGILWRCLAAYCGIDFKSLDSSSSDSLKKFSETNKKTVNTMPEEGSNSIMIETTDSIPLKDDEELAENEKNLMELQKLIGNSVYLIELLRNHPLPLNSLMSPLLSDDSILKKMPKTYLITSSHDPLLDDNIEFKKRLDKLENLNCQLHILDGLHHGFLNFILVSDDCKRASQFVTKIIKSGFE